MNKAVNDLIQRLTSQPETIMFEEVMLVIDEHFNFNPVGFDNGEQRNEAGENAGSCKVLSFSEMYNLNKEQALGLFAQYYRDVIKTPDGCDHQNIRQFMQYGFSRLSFDDVALTPKDIV